MAQVTIHKEPGVTVEIIDGFPPTDQSALVAELRAALASETQSASAAREALAAAVAERNVLQTEKDAAVAELNELAAKVVAFKIGLEGLTA